MEVEAAKNAQLLIRYLTAGADSTQLLVFKIHCSICFVRDNEFANVVARRTHRDVKVQTTRKMCGCRGNTSHSC
jgi:hypothetical protein